MMNYRILRPCLWFAKGDVVKDEKFWEYFKHKAVVSLLKDGFVEVVSDHDLKKEKEDGVKYRDTRFDIHGNYIQNDIEKFSFDAAIKAKFEDVNISKPHPSDDPLTDMP
jgi:hypothetical protein